MTIPDHLRAWQERMHLTTYTAPIKLGVGRRTYMAWLSGETAISRVAALACAAVEAGLPPIGEADQGAAGEIQALRAVSNCNSHPSRTSRSASAADTNL